MKPTKHHSAASLKKNPGISSRITISVVREDACEVPADSPEKLYNYWHTVVAAQPSHESEKESLVVVLLDSRLRAFAWNLVSLGTVNETISHPREILRPVIVGGAYAFALMHNHPSGDPSPSHADEVLTHRIKEAAELMQLRLVDHVIVGTAAPGRSPYFSFREAGGI